VNDSTRLVTEQTSESADAERLAQRLGIDLGFRVRDEATANWLVRRVNEARAYEERARAWAAHETRRARQDADWLRRRYGPQLEAWVRQELAARHHRRRSLNLPAGRVGYRRSPPQLVIDHEDRALDWCRRHLPTAVQTTERLSKRELNAHIQNTGEVPGGTELIPEQDTFFIQ